MGVEGIDFEPGDAIVEATASGGDRVERVKNEELAIGQITRMEGQAEQAAFAHGIHPGPDIQKGREVWIGEVGDHLDASGFLDDEEPIRFVGRRDDGHGSGEAQPGKGDDHTVALAGRVGRELERGVGNTPREIAQQSRPE